MKAPQTSQLTNEQFLSHVEADPNGGCWLWGRTIGVHGYGTSRSRGKQVLAHRESYVRFVGPIPDGALICHHCDVRACVRPDHLYAGDRKTNGDDMARRGRAYRNTKITPEMELAIKSAQDSVEVLAERFGVSDRTIRHHRRRLNVQLGASNRNRSFVFYRGIAPTVSGRFIAYHLGLSLGTYDTLLEAIWVKAANTAKRKALPKHDETLLVVRSGLSVMEQLEEPLSKRQTRDLIAQQDRIERILDARGWLSNAERRVSR